MAELIKANLHDLMIIFVCELVCFLSSTKQSKGEKKKNTSCSLITVHLYYSTIVRLLFHIFTDNITERECSGATNKLGKIISRRIILI